MQRLSALSICLALVGCASTTITGYSDPAYSRSQYNSTVVIAENVGLEKAAALETGICEGFQNRKIACKPFQSVFPPTRQHGPDTVFPELRRQGIDSLIVLSAGGDYSSSQNFGYESFGSATINGNRVQGSSSSVALTAFSRQSHLRITLVDVDTRETAWLGDARTEGQGLVNTTDDAFNSSFSSEVVDTLMRSSHF